ncbi:MAG: aspartyl protease family protein [Bacteroidales bacterium]|nr:aspartyl protease family protein [Bacteroidales bacterium]MDD4671585.1 aspartyl protease family protein [Bacteroidales bacterium]MDY0347677.1 aspartyl protease family protein [Tenuifilaceae bacterium]
MKETILKTGKIIAECTLILSFLLLIIHKSTNILVRNIINSSTVSFSSNKWLEIPIKINGSDAYGLFDTAASSCVIDKSAIGKFDVYEIPLKVIQVNNHTWHSVCIIKSLKVGDMVFRNILAVVVDLKGENKVLQCAKSDIIIGTPIINQLCWDFNFGSKKLFVSKSNDFIQEQNYSNSILYLGRTLYKTDVKVNGYKHNLIIDLGFIASVFLPQNFADSTSGVKYKNSGKKNVFGNYYEQGKRDISDIVLGDDTITNVSIDYRDNKLVPNILGLEVVKRYAGVTIDPFKKRMYFKEGKESNATAKFHGFGLIFGIQNNALVVTSIIESSPAQKAGIKYGDKISQICNKALSNRLITADYCSFLQMRDSLLTLKTMDIEIVREDTISLSLSRGYF